MPSNLGMHHVSEMALEIHERMFVIMPTPRLLSGMFGTRGSMFTADFRKNRKPKREKGRCHRASMDALAFRQHYTWKSSSLGHGCSGYSHICTRPANMDVIIVRAGMDVLGSRMLLPFACAGNMQALVLGCKWDTHKLSASHAIALRFAPLRTIPAANDYVL